MPQRLLNDIRHWQDRAAEVRAIAGQFDDPEAKRIMLGIADGYDRMAKHAAARRAKSQADAVRHP